MSSACLAARVSESGGRTPVSLSSTPTHKLKADVKPFFSLVMNNGNPSPSRGHNDGGYYGNYNRRSGYGPRPESYVDGYAASNQYHAPARNGYSRNHSEPMLYGGHPQQVYPSHSYQQSYDTVTSGEQPWGTSTDPSSLNSSVDRIQQPAQPPTQPGIPEDRVPTETYGFSGFGGKPQLDVQGPAVYNSQQAGSGHGTTVMNSGYQTGSPSTYTGPSAGGPVRYPQQMPQGNKPRVPIKLDAPSGNTLDRTESKVSNAGKRKSWFRRRFSKDRD